MEKILIVDDSITIQRILKHTLQRLGYDVITASSGIQALAQLAQAPVDLAIIDLSMPEMDGFELLQQVRRDATYTRLPVIMLTASGTHTHKSAAQLLGANAFLNKPVSSGELLETVARVLASAPQESPAEIVSPAVESSAS